MKKPIITLSLSLFSSIISLQTLEAQQKRFGDSPWQSSPKGNDKNAAQNDNNGNGNPHNQPSDAPIDGGLCILLAAGVVYGIKKVKDRQADANAEAGK